MTDRIRSFDRYSNTLLVSLNNRIAIRNTYSARGGLVNCQVMTGPGISAGSGATTETPTSQTENTQENAMKQLDSLSEVEVEEGVNCKSRERRVILWYPLSHASSSSRSSGRRLSVMPIFMN